MKPLTSRLLVASLLLGGAATFTVTRSFSGGPFDGAGQSGGSPTSGDVQAVLLGQALSADSLTLTHAAPNEDALLLREDTRLRFAPSSVNANAYMYFNGSDGFHMQNQLNMGDGVFITVDNLQSKRASETISLYGAHGATLVPQSSVDACASGRKGQITAKSSDGRLYACDGTSNGKLATITSWSSSINFAAVGARTCADQSFTATGAVLDEPVACGGCGSVHNADAHMSCTCSITATDTATIRLCCHDNSSCADLSAITFSVAAVR